MPTPEPELHISKRLQTILPVLTDEERAQLKANILADGAVTDPIIYWYDGKRNVVVDGMHRFDIARGEGLPFPCREIKLGDTYEHAELWIRQRQFGRRNLLSPQAQRTAIGKLYNTLKRADGGHGDQRAGDHFGTPLQSAAAEVSRKTGVPESTVKKLGAREEALSKCAGTIQKGVNSGTIKATDAEIKALSKATPKTQFEIAKAVRNGDTLSDAMAGLQTEKTPKSKPTKKTPPKKFDRAAYYKRWDSTIGPLCRLVEEIARGVGEQGNPAHKAIRGQLEAATETMAEWMGVE